MMIRLAAIHPLSDFVRNSKAHISKLKESKTPQVLTVNGRAEVVVQDAESYQELLDEVEAARLVRSLIEAEADYAAGKLRPAEKVFADLKSKHAV